VLEEVTGLPVDLEWPVLIDVVDIKPFHTFRMVLQPRTTDYDRVAGGTDLTASRPPTSPRTSPPSAPRSSVIRLGGVWLA